MSDTVPRPEPPAGRASLANVNLFVRDPERARRFYVDALGLRDDPRSAPPHFVLLDAGSGCTLTLQDAAAMGEPLDRLGGVELGFELADEAALEPARARVAAAGGAAEGVNVMGWARGFDGRDPDGHRLTVFVRAAGGGR
ncbi:hypothetical protein tb265_43120 [Gemmatimonadetes bacterium T265]|nr:hypothetical protein tb265_43120 [Gemmatimonadetes bacterium T265]